jgi:hypothetical protein
MWAKCGRKAAGVWIALASDGTAQFSPRRLRSSMVLASGEQVGLARSRPEISPRIQSDAKLRVVRFTIRAVIVLAVLAVASQFAVPPLMEHHLAGQLTAGGGTADVELSAFPAIRLAFGHGDRIEIRGRDLHLPTSSEQAGNLDQLDHYDHVDVRLRDSRIGPVAARNLVIRRDGSFPYRVRASGHTTVAHLANVGAGKLGLLEGAALRIGTHQALGARANEPIPVHLHMSLSDQSGRLVVVGGSGSVAGVKAGPLAELITSAVAVRL